jgi:hypothetical protein
MDNEENIKPSYFSIMTAEVRYDEELKPMEKILYSEITALSNKLGYCYASNSYFAKLYKVDKLTVSRWISNLVKKKYLYNDMTMTDSKTERKLFVNLDSYIKYSGKSIDYIMDILKDQGGLTEKSMGVDQKIKGGVDQKINLIIQDNNNKLNKDIYSEVSNSKKEINSINNDMLPDEIEFRNFFQSYQDMYLKYSNRIDMSHANDVRKLLDICNGMTKRNLATSILSYLERLFWTHSQDEFWSKTQPHAVNLSKVHSQANKILEVGEKPSVETNRPKYSNEKLGSQKIDETMRNNRQAIKDGSYYDGADSNNADSLEDIFGVN